MAFDTKQLAIPAWEVHVTLLQLGVVAWSEDDIVVERIEGNEDTVTVRVPINLEWCVVWQRRRSENTSKGLSEQEKGGRLSCRFRG